VQIKFPDRDAQGMDHRYRVIVVKACKLRTWAHLLKQQCFFLAYRKCPAGFWPGHGLF
jgi:hypothetical protein